MWAAFTRRRKGAPIDRQPNFVLALPMVIKPLEVFCIQVHALETISAKLRLAVHPSTL